MAAAEAGVDAVADQFVFDTALNAATNVDTLFLEGCGRTDLPGSNPAEMADSLRRLSQVPDETILFPGHRYSAASSASMETVKQINAQMQQRNYEGLLK